MDNEEVVPTVEDLLDRVARLEATVDNVKHVAWRAEALSVAVDGFLKHDVFKRLDVLEKNKLVGVADRIVVTETDEGTIIDISSTYRGQSSIDITAY